MTEAIAKKLDEIQDNISLGCWTVDDRGVTRKKNIYKDGEIVSTTTETASPIPIIPTALLENTDTNTEKLELSFYKHNRWQSLITERSVTASRNGIIKLSDRGIEVNSDNSGMLVKYIADVVAWSLPYLPHKTAKSVMGWIDGEFMPYTDKVVFDGDEQFKHLYKSLTDKGELAEWVDFVKPLRANKDLRLCMAASFASPSIEVIGENPFVFHLWGGTGAGKAQPLDTKIITPNGYKLMGDIIVGDEVIGGDGKPHSVTGIFPQGKKEVYEITFSDGRKTRCCKEHLWNVTTRTRRNHSRGYTVMSLEEMMKRPVKTNKGFTYQIPLCKPVEYVQSEKLPIAPYLLGALIGDGCLTLKTNRANRSTTLYFNNSEYDVIGRVMNELNKIGAKMRFNAKSSNQFSVACCKELKEHIVSLGLNVKSPIRFIPDVYKKSSVSDRRLLLAGLIDTDGSVSERGAVSYSSRSKQLALDICEVAHGLGYKATVGKSTRGDFNVSIVSDGDVFLSKKHTDRMNVAKAKRNRAEDTTAMAITSIELVGNEACQCIMVDSEEHTYLCDDYIVTHNTIALMVAMSIWGDPAIGKMTRTMNMTANSMLTTAAFLRNLPFAGDELQTIKSRWTNYDNLIMCITEGIDRGRMSYDKVNDTKAWKCSFIFSGEEPCIKQASGGGAKNRVIEVECKGKLVENGNLTANFVRTHYGCAGKPYIDHIKTINVSEIYSKTFQEILSSTDTTDKQAGSMALILTADGIASQLFWSDEKPLTVDDVKQYLCSNAEVDVAERAYEYVCGVIAENRSNFCESAKQAWGNIDGNYVYINKTVLSRIMDEAGFDFEAVKTKWEEKGYIERNSQGRYSFNKSISGVKTAYVKLCQSRFEEDIEPEYELPFND